MLRELAKGALRPINAGLRRVGVQIVHSHRAFEDYRDYIPFDETVEGARASGMSVGDYIDTRHNVPGATADTIDRLKAMGVLHGGVRRICEIGPGSGRYLERTIAICHPERYEIYETAEPWRRYLMDKHDLVSQPTDGRSLASTASESVELVHAHKVFPGLPFLVALRYFAEMARVTAPGGRVVFDMVTEACMDEETVARWFAQDTDYDSYPDVMPRAYVVDFFARRGFEADAGFIVPMKPGKTEYMVFTRR